MGHEVEAGQVLDGRFQIASVIARSGMASIFKATDAKTGKAVAVKVPFMQVESDPALFSRFQREEEIGKRLSHPSILQIISVEDKSRPYIAMEYLEGETLGTLLRKTPKLPLDRALSIAIRVADALSYMHAAGRNVVHRDLKPDNIMLCTDGSLRIMDFGIAKADLRRITFAGFSTTLGTPQYMAPEQVKGQRGDARTDIYSLGAMLYEMLTGAEPFPGGNPYDIMNARLVGDTTAPRKINPELSPALEEIVLHAMERRPDDRYSSAAEMKAELEHPENVKITGRCDRLQAVGVWQLKWRGLRTTVLAIVIPIVAIIVFFVLFHKR